MTVLIQHDLDPETEYCRKCGAAVRDIIDRQYGCTDAPNIVGISHQVRGSVLKDLAKQIFGQPVA